MKAVPILLVFVFACVLPLQARIGETPEQIAQRYGPVVKADAVIDDLFPSKLGQLHRKNGIDVYVVYEKGLAARVRFCKPQKSDLWTSDEVEMLLKANSDGRAWSREDQPAKGLASEDTTFKLLGSAQSLFNAPVGVNLSATWAHETTVEVRNYLEIQDVGYAIRETIAEGKKERDASQKQLAGF